jgi:type I restriction enzyme S subunit
VLSSLDDKIDLLHRQNKTLESMAETLFRQWFIEEAQDEWPEKSLNQYVELNKSSISKSMISKRFNTWIQVLNQRENI